jgi:hypothetical protein
VTIWNYTAGAELPAITIEALDADGQPINFSSGWTFEVKVGEPGKTAVVTASTVVGAATVPNLTVNWTAGALDSLVVGHRLHGADYGNEYRWPVEDLHLTDPHRRSGPLVRVFAGSLSAANTHRVPHIARGG